MARDPFDDEDVESPGVGIVEERPPLREGRVFVDYCERATIRENLEAAYVALNAAFRGIWVENILESGHVREYWDEGDIDELETLALDAADAARRAYRALDTVMMAHADQVDAELGSEEDGG